MTLEGLIRMTNRDYFRMIQLSGNEANNILNVH